tara:strand:+ start:1348 stop:1539 length:192 start_codon:yes stop_codon:yes gene_type:complete
MKNELYTMLYAFKITIMTIEINVVEWVLYIVVIWLALALADTTLALYKRYLEWKIKKLKDKRK